MKATKLLLFFALVSCAYHQPAVFSTSPETIREQIQSKTPEFRECALTNTASSRPDEVKMKINFFIDNEGAVKKERIKETNLGNAAFENCVLKVIKPLRFAPHQEGEEMEVIQEVNFRLNT